VPVALVWVTKDASMILVASRVRYTSLKVARRGLGFLLSLLTC
jgi:hypothetical protein